MEASQMSTGWTDGKLWEIAWGELRWEGATLQRRRGGRTGNVGNSSPQAVERERHFSDDRVDGRETVGNSLGRAPWGRSDTEATRGWTES